MLKTTLRHLYRDRRRLAVTWTLLVAANIADVGALPRPAPWLSTELALSALIFMAVPAISVFLTRHRHWTEVVALATCAFLMLGHALPGSPFDHTGPYAFSPLSWTLYGLMILAARTLLYGRWSDRFTPHGRVTVRSRLISSAPLKPLWYGLVPTPGQIDFSPDPEVVSIDYADAARRTVRLVTWLPPRGAGETLLHIHEIEPFRHVRLSMEILRGPSDEGTRGETVFEIVDRGRDRHVRMSHTYNNGYPPRRLLRSWLDDTFGRMMDARLEAIEISASSADSTKARVSFDSWYADPENAHGTPRPPAQHPAQSPAQASAPGKTGPKCARRTTPTCQSLPPPRPSSFTTPPNWRAPASAPPLRAPAAPMPPTPATPPPPARCTADPPTGSARRPRPPDPPHLIHPA